MKNDDGVIQAANRNRLTTIFSLLAILSGALFSPNAQSQSVSSPLSASRIAEEGLRRQEERARDLQPAQTGPDALRPAGVRAAPTELPEETPCFPIREVRFTGADAHRFSWLEMEVAPFLNRCLGVEGLHRVAATIDAKLIEWGYATTRMTLPAQNLSDGILSLHLHVGRVDEVRSVKMGTEQTPDDGWGTWRNAFSISDGEILNVRDLEQGIEQMQRLPSQGVTTRIEPGSLADTSIVVIERRTGTFAERLHGGITLDNSGSKSLGRTQVSGSASLDNPLGLNDLVSISASSNVEGLQSDHRSQSYSASYSIPFGYYTLSLSKSKNHFAELVQGTTVQFLSSGESSSDEIRLHRTVLRTASSKFGVYAALSSRSASSFLDDVELIVQRRRTTNFELGISYKKLIGDASFDFGAGYRRGVPWRGAHEDFPENNDGLTLRPKIWTASAGYSQAFSVGKQAVRYSLTLRSQHTRDTTLSIDQIALGSRYSVRGFDGDAVLLAENGYQIQNELATSLATTNGVVSQVYFGIDLGHVWGPSTINLVGNKLAGAVLGWRGQWQGIQFDLAVGTPLYHPSGFQTRSLNPYLAVTYAF